jgi:hypothetical protein
VLAVELAHSLRIPKASEDAGALGHVDQLEIAAT